MYDLAGALVVMEKKYLQFQDDCRGDILDKHFFLWI